MLLANIELCAEMSDSGICMRTSRNLCTTQKTLGQFPHRNSDASRNPHRDVAFEHFDPWKGVAGKGEKLTDQARSDLELDERSALPCPRVSCVVA